MQVAYSPTANGTVSAASRQPDLGEALEELGATAPLIAHVPTMAAEREAPEVKPEGSERWDTETSVDATILGALIHP